MSACYEVCLPFSGVCFVIQLQQSFQVIVTSTTTFLDSFLLNKNLSDTVRN
jgi:hypothetical protein